MATWKSKITKKELKHVRFACNGTPTLKRFSKQRATQRRMRDKELANKSRPGIAEPCWECKSIAQKLGLE